MPNTCNLREIRLANALSLVDLAKLSGVHRNTIGLIENGADPRLSIMNAIASACHRSVSEIWPGINRQSEIEKLQGFGEARRLVAMSRKKIVALRNNKLRLWAIAKDTGVSVDAVRIILLENGERLSSLNHKREIQRQKKPRTSRDGKIEWFEAKKETTTNQTGTEKGG